MLRYHLRQRGQTGQEADEPLMGSFVPEPTVPRRREQYYKPRVSETDTVRRKTVDGLCFRFVKSVYVVAYLRLFGPDLVNVRQVFSLFWIVCY